MKDTTNESLIGDLSFEDVLLDSLPNPVYYKDAKGRFIRCNNSFAKLIHKKKEEIIGRLAYDFFSKKTSNKHKKIDNKLMKTFGSNDDRIVYVNPIGQTIYLSLTKTVYLNKDGSVGGIVCVMHDITQRVKEREFLIQQSKLVEVGEILTSVVHQWNEPLVELSALVQNIEFLYSQKMIDDVHMADFVKNSMKQIKYMSQTLLDFRSFLKPSIKKDEFCIKKTIREVLQIVSRQIFYFNIHILLEYTPSNEKILIYGYKNEFKQVLLNIINNAKNKIIKNKYPTMFNPKIVLRVVREKTFTLIEIKDNGGTINNNIIDKIFNPFFTTSVSGTGFGLYMAKLIVEDKMSGQIDVKNCDEFVIFSIKIPHKDLL